MRHLHAQAHRVRARETERDKERERERDLPICVCVYICINMFYALLNFEPHSGEVTFRKAYISHFVDLTVVFSAIIYSSGLQI